MPSNILLSLICAYSLSSGFGFSQPQLVTMECVSFELRTFFSFPQSHTHRQVIDLLFELPALSTTVNFPNFIPTIFPIGFAMIYTSVRVSLSTYSVSLYHHYVK